MHKTNKRKTAPGVDVKPVVIRLTNSDLMAYCLLQCAGIIPTVTDRGWSFTDAGNHIIQLAERIKAERSVISMHV